jgi:hypothetical protein
MAIKNYSTEIDVWKTIGEINQLLAKAGAQLINIRNEGGEPAGISFSIDQFNFLLPCDPAGVYAHLVTLKGQELSRARSAGKGDLMQQARRISWRVTKDWIDAQIAFIEAQRAQDRARQLVTVFLPYIVNTEGETIASKLLSGDNLKKLGY